METLLCTVAGGVVLRPPQLTDLPAVIWHGGHTDPDEQWLGMIDVPHPCSGEQAEELLAELMRGWAGRFGLVRFIVDLQTDNLLGKVGLSRHSPTCIEVSYGIAAGSRGRGLATRVLRLVAEEVLERARIAERLEAVIDPKNLASVRVATKTGFVYDGLRRGVVPGTDMPFEDLVYVRSRERKHPDGP